jgi:hypothetical protein
MFKSAGSIAPASTTRDTADVYIINGQDAAVGAAAAAIQQFVSSGGGLVIGAQAWSWSSSNSISQHPSNLVLNKMGIVVSSIVEANNYTFTGSSPRQIGNVDVWIKCIRDSCTGVNNSTCYMSSDKYLASAMEALNDAAGYIPLDASFWATVQQVWCALVAAFARHKGSCSSTQLQEVLLCL